MKLKHLIEPKPNEEILLVVRGSFVPRLGWFVFNMLMFFFPFLLLYPLFQLGMIGVGIFCALVAITLFLLWKLFRRWSYTLLIITDRRLIDIDQRGMFDRVVTECTFDQIEDISHRSRGMGAALFKYGTIRILMRGEAPDIVFLHAPRPLRIQDLLNDLRLTSHEHS